MNLAQRYADRITAPLFREFGGGTLHSTRASTRT